MRSGQVSRQVGTAQQSKLVASRTSRSSGGSTVDDSHSVSRESRSLSINEGRERNPRPRRSSAARERERQERQERKHLKEKKKSLLDGPESSETNSSDCSTRNSGYSLSESVGPDDQAQLLRAIRDYETKSSSKSEHSRSTGGFTGHATNGTPSQPRRTSNQQPNERLQMSGSGGPGQQGANGLNQSAPSGKKSRKTEIVFAVGNKKLASISLGGGKPKDKDKEKKDKDDDKAEKKDKQRGSSGNLKMSNSDAKDSNKDSPLNSPTSNNTNTNANANANASVNTNAASSTAPHHKDSAGARPNPGALSSSAPSRAREHQFVLGQVPSIAISSANSPKRRPESPRPALHPLIGNILLTVYRVSRTRFYRCAALNKEWRKESQIILTSYVRDHSPTAQAALANAGQDSARGENKQL